METGKQEYTVTVYTENHIGLSVSASFTSEPPVRHTLGLYISSQFSKRKPAAGCRILPGPVREKRRGSY